jgi:hypothetical protein
VREHIHLVFTARGATVVTVVQEVDATDDIDSDNRSLADRAEEARSNLEHGDDPWSRRFDMLAPTAEHQSLHRIDGEIRRATRTVVLESFEDVLRVLEMDGLTGSLVRRGHVNELELFPTGGSRATAAQRREAERRLEQWSATIYRYATAVAELYAYLDDRPQRAVPCLAHVFDQHENLPADGPLSRAEETSVLEVKESMEAVAEALLVPEDAAFSLNQLLRLVYDPLPARLTIAVEGAVVRHEGFLSRNGSLERPAVDAWSSLQRAVGRWLVPDPVTAAVALPLSGPQPELDIESIASMPRRALPPSSAADVEAAILSELAPLDRHWLRWRTLPEGGDGLDSRSAGWLEIIAAAEASVPD